MKELEYPFDSEYILKKKKSLKKALLSENRTFIDKKIAILGGSTTNDIKLILELFLLNYGIRPTFYESEYNRFYQDGFFDNPTLAEFAPDLIYIHTSFRNITALVNVTDTKESANALINSEYSRFEALWDRLSSVYKCPVIQNNFEYPFYRMLGNLDGNDYRGKTFMVRRLNLLFAEYADSHENFHINDINYISSCYGLDEWSDPFYWHMYKYALCVPAIPTLAFNIASIIKSIFGKNKKALALDLDNTLWGGIVGDDGVDNLVLGPETSMGQVYTEWQSYLKELKMQGILLNVDSKNDYENAVSGLKHPDSLLKPEDFVNIKANWDPKSHNLIKMASEIGILPESFVFVDDNPAEREIIKQEVADAAIAELDTPEHYIRALDKAAYFEPVRISSDDLKRNEMYRENSRRAELMASFSDYGEYLDSLEMKGIIKPFEPVFMARISQLTGKSNQFNLTTRRYSQNDLEEMSRDINTITLYGKLIDKFGDNGVVSVVIGKLSEKELTVDLWLMSCRVLKRDMEFAMMDELVRLCRERGVTTIYGEYIKTAKNSMVKDFYGIMGFELVSENEEGSRWKLCLSDYSDKNIHIKVNE